jgi:hypothetical protein
MNRCNPPADRKPCIIRSRFRSGRCEFSARLFRPLCDRCSTEGITSRFAAPYERSLSVMIRFGVRPCFFSSLTSNRLAAFVSRRGCTISSRTYPCWLPKPVFLAVYGNHHLVQIPDVLSRRLLPSQLFCVGSTELAAPSPDRFIGDNDAALQKHFLDQPQAQRKPEIEPHGMGNDLQWKTMILVADDRRVHGTGLAVNR